MRHANSLPWPMALVLRKADMKVVSVSRKKLKCSESIYTLDPRQINATTGSGMVQFDNPDDGAESGIFELAVASTDGLSHQGECRMR